VAAIGAAVAVTLGAGGIGYATTTSGERSIYNAIEPWRLADTRPAPNEVGPRAAVYVGSGGYRPMLEVTSSFNVGYPPYDDSTFEFSGPRTIDNSEWVTSSS